MAAPVRVSKNPQTIKMQDEFGMPTLKPSPWGKVAKISDF